MAASRRIAIAAMFLDVTLAALFAIECYGGIWWHDKLILRHGADLRRSILILGALAAVGSPAIRGRSLWIRAAFGFWRALETRRGRWTALAAGCTGACIMGVLQALALQFPMYDVGLYHQVFWGVANGDGFVSTISGAGNYLLDHLSLSYTLFVPLFTITGSSPLLLPVLHPILIFTGIAAWVWLAERIPSRWPDTLAASCTLFGLTFDSLWRNRTWGFHDTSVYFAAMSWAFALLWLDAHARAPDCAPGHAPARWRKPVIVALMAIAAMSKEIELLDVGLLGLVWASVEARRGRWRLAGGLMVFAVVLFGVFVWFEQLHHPADKNYFERYYAYLGHDLGSFTRSLLLSPWKVVDAIGAMALLRYGLTVFGPWLLLPLTGGWSRVWLLALLPSFASAALSTDSSLRGSSFHYVLELWPILAVLTVVALARKSSVRWPVAWALLSLLAWDHDPVKDVREFVPQAIAASEVRTRFSEMPPAASVAADEMSGTWLASRLAVTRWPSLDAWSGRCPDWAILRTDADVATMRRVCGIGDAAPTWQVGEWRAFRLR